MIQPKEIMIGSCFNQVINEHEPCTPKPIIWDETNWYRIGECIEFYEWFEPIPLTEKILVDWCGFDPNDKFNFFGHFGIGTNAKGLYCLIYSSVHCVTIFEDIAFEYLHTLQRFYLDFKNQPLKIEMK